MKTPTHFAFACLCLLSFRAAATTYYVDINSPNPTPPYTSWSTAATNIQDAVAETVNGDLILVNPGVYQSSGCTAPDGALTAVDVTNAITIQGVNGAAQTLINGSNVMRCVYLANGTTLAGLTLTNGNAYNGGGAYCASTAGVLISNCVLTANSAVSGGGGVYQGSLMNCTISDNFGESEFAEGGGAYDAVLADCMIISNSIFGGDGCGVYNSSVTNSVIADNTPWPPDPTYENSQGGGAYMGTLYHCNIIGNSAINGGGTFNATLVNCINYYNTVYTNYSSSPNSSNYFEGTIEYTCTSPNAGYSSDITADPRLASVSHISLASPCRGAGTSADSSGVDIDGNLYASPPSMGCFEPYPGSVLGNLSVAISTPITNGAPGYPLNFQANISGPVYSNLWSFGDGTSITNQVFVSHAWTAPGTYSVTLTAYNDTYYPTGVTATLPITIGVPSVYYVNLYSLNPVPPYLSWATAAANIQDAVSVAVPGSLVLVTNGPGIFPYTNKFAIYMNGGATETPYHSFYRVAVTNPVTIESVNGPATTYIQGSVIGEAAGCVYLTNGAVLIGFTLTNGDAEVGGGVYAATNAVVTNCVITHCSANSLGAAAYSGTFYNCSIVHITGGAYQSALNGCTLAWDSVAEDNCLLTNCVLSSNSASSYGAAAYGGTLNNCLICSNSTSSFGSSAAYADAADPLALNNCLISNNVTPYGTIYNAYTATSAYYTNCILNNCVLTRNYIQYQSGAAYDADLANCLVSSNSAPNCPTVEGGLLVNCTLIGNSNTAAADGSHSFSRPILTNCTLIGNIGQITADECTLDQCTIQQNTGAGAFDSTLYQCAILQNGGSGAEESALNDCLIISNVPASGLGAPVSRGGGAYECELTNCILAYDVATNGGGAYQSTLVNCTVIANTGITGGGIYDSTADNCILYYNNGGDYYPATTQYPLNYCSTLVPASNGFRNIANAPLFVNFAGGDYHLQSTSPCINSGNNAYISSATDLDGNPRIAGGTVDIGAYEYQTPTSVISYAYLQQFGLPTDGSVDFSDLDGTAFNVYQDWIAGLNPTNSASVLAMLTPVTTNNPTGVTVTWQSVSGIPYLLQRSTNLISQSPFSTIQNNITGQANTTSYTDTTATNNVPYLYRVGVIAP